MSIKVILLKSGDQIITDVKEVISEDKPVAYLFTNPQKVTINKPFLISEQDNERCYRDWETDRKSTRLNSSHSAKSRMPSSA